MALNPPTACLINSPMQRPFICCSAAPAVWLRDQFDAPGYRVSSHHCRRVLPLRRPVSRNIRSTSTSSNLNSLTVRADRFFETLDGAHERFSFYSIFGFAVMMPHLWTLQTQYLASHPVELSTAVVVMLLIGFAVGWTLNHVANDQKNISRRTNGKFCIAGREAETIEAKYQTADGKTHRTILLCSGEYSLHKAEIPRDQRMY